MNRTWYHLRRFLYRTFGREERALELELRYYRAKGVRIGHNMRAFSPLLSGEPYLLEFGDNVTVSTGVRFITHDNSVIKVVDTASDSVGRIVIGNNCFIGLGALLLPGITLGDNTIVGAGSVVTKSFRDGDVVIAGNPARVICSIEEYTRKTRGKALDLKGMSWREKKTFLLGMDEERFLRR